MPRNLLSGLLPPTVARAVGAQPSAPMGAGFPTELILSDFTGERTSAQTIALAKGHFTPIGTLTRDGFAVPPQTRIAIGSGGPHGAGHNQGYITVALRGDTGLTGTSVKWIDGVFRISVSDANGQVVRTVFESRTEQLRATVTAEDLKSSVETRDINKQVALPQSNVMAGEDDLIIISIKADTADNKIQFTPTRVTSIIRIPATRFYLRDGAGQ